MNKIKNKIKDMVKKFRSEAGVSKEMAAAIILLVIVLSLTGYFVIIKDSIAKISNNTNKEIVKMGMVLDNSDQVYGNWVKKQADKGIAVTVQSSTGGASTLTSVTDTSIYEVISETKNEFGDVTAITVKKIDESTIN